MPALYSTPVSAGIISKTAGRTGCGCDAAK
jgi:hypothetical protein